MGPCAGTHPQGHSTFSNHMHNFISNTQTP